MHTLIMIVVGLLLLWIAHLVSAARKVRFLRFFPIFWFVICVIHLAIGLNEGYALDEELKIHALVFGIPVLVWLGLTQYLKRRTGLVLLAFCFLAPSLAQAEYEGHRLGIGVGIAQVGDSSHSYFAIGGEYEYRMDDFFGLGMSGNYVFSDPAFGLLAVPQGYLHPLAGEWYINAAPLFQFGGGLGTHLGIRVGTRLPLHLGALSIIPQVNIDFINGGRNLLFGIGIAI